LVEIASDTLCTINNLCTFHHQQQHASWLSFVQCKATISDGIAQLTVLPAVHNSSLLLLKLHHQPQSSVAM